MRMRYTQTVRTNGKEEIRQVDIEDMGEDKAGEILLQLMDQSILNIPSAEVEFNYDDVVFNESEVEDDKIVPIDSKRPRPPTPPSHEEPEDVELMTNDELIAIALENGSMKYNHDNQLSMRTLVDCPECGSTYDMNSLEWFKFIKCRSCKTQLRLDQTSLFSKYIADHDGHHFIAKDYYHG